MNKDDIIQSQIEPLLNYFQKVIPLNNEEKQLVTELFKPRLYRKRQYVLQEGDVCNQFNFIVRGCLRMYKVDGKGNTHILQFAAENWWLSNIGSFHERKPSELNIDALEDTMVLQISYDNLVFLYTKAPKFDRIFRVLIENSFVSLQKRLLQNISSTAEERYLSFLESYLHLNNRLPQTQIASFLGITPEFLSRLRNKQTKKLKLHQHYFLMQSIGEMLLSDASLHTMIEEYLFWENQTYRNQIGLKNNFIFKNLKN